MKRFGFIVCALWTSMALCAAENKPAPAGTSQSLPAGAKRVQPDVYRYTDAAGKSWLYQRTPCGFTKLAALEGSGERAIAFGQAVDSIQAFDEGDSVRFEQPSPFGMVRWTRKKSRLNELERAAWDREQNSRKTATGGAGQD